MNAHTAPEVSLNGALNRFHLDHWSDHAFREHIPAVRTTIEALENMTARSLHFERECEDLKLKLVAALSDADQLRNHTAKCA